ncbi:MAG TPA: DUF6599 family protein [Pyrinomonadaceae bacterium]|nr:DUF6599 family protein [Pyrinomonadaceae bacterium]
MSKSQKGPRSKIVSAVLLAAFSILACTSFGFAGPAPESPKVFPATLGSFKQLGRTKEVSREQMQATLALINDLPKEVSLFSLAETEYVAANGEKLRVALSKFDSDAAAYCQFTLSRRILRDQGGAQPGRVDGVGTASVVIPGPGLMFFKGPTVVTITSETGKSLDQVTDLARLLAATVDKGEGDIPVLVKHLPNWETARAADLYVVNMSALESAVANQPIVKEVTFEGGTEAVTADYGQSQLLIVEFTTPQFSVDNDQRIAAKIQELRNQGQPVPTAYRRVGNYSVLVFNAPDEKSANELIDQVKYEQVVQWLGDDPYLYEKLQRYLAQTSAGVLIAVLKSSGLSLILCLGIGVLIGVLLFRHRRAQKASVYSDAGGSVRLNLDELTGTRATNRLLGSGGASESDPNRS